MNIFSTFQSNDIRSNIIRVISNGIWSNNTPDLSTFFTSSAQTDTQKKYFYQVWNASPVASGSEQQFSVAYGNRFGSGSNQSQSSVDDPTKAIYSQMKVTVLEPGDNIFTFNSGSTTQDSDQIYVLTIDRARIKDSLDPGGWELYLATLSGSAVANNVHTGSNVKVKGDNSVVSLIDDSEVITTGVNITNALKRYNIISGSLVGGAYTDGGGNYHYYGFVYPQLGLMVFNGLALNQYVAFNSVSGSIAGDNAFKLFTSISGAAAINSTYDFSAVNNQKTISSNYFVRVGNSDYNFSNNPTFISGANGQILQPFINDPQTFVTTVGLYNNNNDLLAVAKVSRPLLKNADSELLVKVRIDY
jgi:hypothetical protein